MKNSVFCLFALSLVVAGCQPKKSKDPKDSSPQITTVKGDPGVFVKDTALAGNAPIPSEFLTPEAQFAANVVEFVEEPRDVAEEALKGQVPENRWESQKEKKTTVFGLTAIDGGVRLQGLYVGVDVIVNLLSVDGGYVLSSLLMDGQPTLGEGSPNELIHSSYSQGTGSLSFMYQNKTVGKRVVGTFYLARMNPNGQNLSKPTILESAYAYLFGAGVPVHWKNDKPTKLLLCSAYPDQLALATQKMVSKWQEALGQRLQLISEVAAPCPPFGDVNAHTINFVDEWIEITGDWAVKGQTSVVRLGESEFIMDADIFINLGEFQENLDNIGVPEKVRGERVMNSPSFMADLSSTILHEIGHLLGLDHLGAQFKDQPSVMSYSQKDRAQVKLFDYDLKAVRELYDAHVVTEKPSAPTAQAEEKNDGELVLPN